MFDSIVKNMISEGIRWVVAAACAYLNRNGISADQSALIADALAIFSVIWLWWENVGQQRIADALKKATGRVTLQGAVASVPRATSAVIGLLALGLALHGTEARAQQKAPILIGNVTCTVTSCPNQVYVGGGLGGVGNSIDIIGAGVDNSVFADGMLPFVTAGWMNWNGATLIGAEAGLGYQFAQGATVGNVTQNQSGGLGWVFFEAGGNLSTIFGTSPVTILGPLQQNLMTLYALAGPVFTKNGGTLPGLGAGAKYCVSGGASCKLQLDLKYVYANDQVDMTKNVQLVLIGLDYGF